MDGGLTGRGAERLDHLRRQWPDHVVRHGDEGHVGQIKGGGRTLTGARAELLRQAPDVFGVTAADRGDRVARVVQGASQR